MRIDVVIGSGFGDEGKGLTTAFWSSQFPELKKKLVVRFNGGAQAGHTVVYNGEKLKCRHVFSHLGSGTFQNADTYLSKFFIVNPMLFFKEYQSIEYLPNIKILVSPDARVTTPFDMMMNQALEIYRSANSYKHGSVGVGINETIKRSENSEYDLRVRDIQKLSIKKIFEKVKKIRDEWIPIRLEQLNMQKMPDCFIDALLSNEIIYRYATDCKYFAKRAKLADASMVNDYDHLIFEGAQGLLLDMDYGQFPYVTPSNTGMKNVNEILNDFSIFDDANVWYISRCYLTRHGSGPLKNEIDMLPFKNVDDKTNVTNKWQDSLRFSYLDVSAMLRAVCFDGMPSKSNRRLNVGYFITCLDQIAQDDDVFVFNEDELVNLGPGVDGMTALLNIFAKRTVNSNVYYSKGPTIEDVILYK